MSNYLWLHREEISLSSISVWLHRSDAGKVLQNSQSTKTPMMLDKKSRKLCAMKASTQTCHSQCRQRGGSRYTLRLYREGNAKLFSASKLPCFDVSDVIDCLVNSRLSPRFSQDYIGNTGTL